MSRGRETPLRALVVADDPELRAACLREVERAGHEVCGASDVAGVSVRVRAARPEMIVVAGVVANEVRQVLERARASAERRLPALLALPANTSWLYTPLPEDLLPAVALAAAEADARGIARAVAMLVAGGRGPAGALRAGPLAFDAGSRCVAGPAGEASLTPSEGALLVALLRDAGAVIPAAEIVKTLWGSALTDRHARAAIRSHVYTLRRTLAGVGVANAIESRRGVGYRLVLEAD